MPADGRKADACRVQDLRRERKVDPEVVQRFARLPVANVSDSMSRLTAGGARLRPRHGGGGMAGPALTVKAPPGDNLMFHKAISLAEPGDVIVVDAGGDLTNALMGEMMLMQITKRGAESIENVPEGPGQVRCLALELDHRTGILRQRRQSNAMPIHITRDCK